MIRPEEEPRVSRGEFDDRDAEAVDGWFTDEPMEEKEGREALLWPVDLSFGVSSWKGGIEIRDWSDSMIGEAICGDTLG